MLKTAGAVRQLKRLTDSSFEMEIWNESEEDEEACREAQERRLEEQEVGPGSRMYWSIEFMQHDTFFLYCIYRPRAWEMQKVIGHHRLSAKSSGPGELTAPCTTRTKKSRHNRKIRVRADTPNWHKKGFCQMCSPRVSRLTAAARWGTAKYISLSYEVSQFEINNVLQISRFNMYVYIYHISSYARVCIYAYSTSSH